jgi:microsomal dipeptidase-like Zn-dependent dipeptidase
VINVNPAQKFTAANGSQQLVTNASKALVLATAATGNTGSFEFEPSGNCALFPEAPTNASGSTFKGKGVDKPVLGFADVHVHISATTFLGGAHSGSPFHPYGITQALGSCANIHGPNGQRDVVGNFLGDTPTGQHDTNGWPTFTSWPAAKSLTHEGMYYKWVERAWLSGLRIMVNDLVENEVLCNLQASSLGNATQNCNEMDSAISQITFMYNLQDYIDAQEGGPGKGWFRIIKTPAEAREVINQGKLAVVLAIEISHLFNCSIYDEVAKCDKATIDAQLDRLYNAGVRQMFPIHEFDNAFGGNGIFNGFVLNLGNKKDTNRFWRTYDCPEVEYLYGAGAIMQSADPSGGTNPISQALIAQTGGQLPIYNTTKKQCNAFKMTDLGKYAFEKLIEKKIIIEVDHLELSIKEDLLKITEAKVPQYPLVSTHGGHGGITMDQAKRILASGGIIYPYKGNGTDFKGIFDTLKKIKADNFFFSVGYGADTNGLGAQAGPRKSGAVPVKYPFTLFQGEGFGSQFAGFSPIVFDKQKSGQRSFDINGEGMAHYGLVADFVEEVRIEGGEEAVTALFNSAEGYLQMWERVLNRP